jgi:hypothetical protein
MTRSINTKKRKMMKNKLWNGLLREEAGEGGEGGGGAGGEGEAPWYANAGFSEEVLADESAKGMLDKYGSPDEFLKGATWAQSKVGEKGLTVPGEDATDEEKAKFFSELGRPETADKYSWQPPEGMAIEPEVYAEKAQALHEAGLSDGQHKAVMDLYASEMTRISEQFQADQAEIAKATEESLRDEWGDDYETNITTTRKMIERVAGEDGLLAAKESGIVNQEWFIKLLHNAAISSKEGTIDQPTTPGSAKEEMAGLVKSEAYKDRTHPGHKQAVRRHAELSGMIGSTM